MMQKRAELYVITEPEAVERKVIHLGARIRVAGSANARPVGRPWPRQHLWRERVRRLKKTHD